VPRWTINFDWKIDFDQDIYVYCAKAEAHRITAARIPIPPNVAKDINKINIIKQKIGRAHV
jgi:hypothetical protein